MAYNHKLYLNFNDFDDHIQTTWWNLQTDQDFCDVTLICNDKQIRSHKFILSSYSPILNNMLKNSKQNPMIFFSGVQYIDLVNILNYIYQGEVNVAKEDINSFLTMANDLKIKGLFLEDESVKLSSNRSLGEEKYNTKSSQENISNKIIDVIEQKNKKNVITPDIHNFSILPEYSQVPQDFHDEKLQHMSPLQNSDDTKSLGINNVCHSSADNDFVDTPENVHENNQKTIDFIPNAKLEHKCDKCNVRLATNDVLIAHVQSDHGNRLFACYQCNYNTTLMFDLDKHIKVMHEEKYHLKYSPGSISEARIEGNNHKNKSNSVTQSIDTLSMDINNSLDVGVLNDSTDASEPMHGNNSKGVDLISKDMILSCEQCNYKTTTISDLNKHINELHERFIYSCDHCDYKIEKSEKYKNEKYALIYHKKMHHKTRHPCAHCDYETICDLKLKKHLKFSHFCDQCDFKARNSNILARHRHKHKVKQYPCDQCSYTCRENAGLQNHIEALHGNSKYLCDDCDYKTTTRKNLLRHGNENHKGIYYFCDQCDTKYKAKNQLKRHTEAAHKGVRFPCDQCDFKATQKSNLKKHINWHFKEKAKNLTL